MMDALLYLWVIFILFIVIAGIYIAIQGSVSNKRRKKLDEIAHDVLAEFDFNKEREEIKSIGSHYVSAEYRCPRCNGMLVMRRGRYGKFWGCNRYSECTYTRNIKS